MKKVWKEPGLEKKRRKPREIFAIIIVIALVGSLFATLGVNLHQQFTSTGSYRTEFSGKVIEKTTTVRATETGSFPINRLHIKNQKGEEFNVVVSKELYDRTHLGMWVKKDKDGVEVSWDKIQ